VSAVTKPTASALPGVTYYLDAENGDDHSAGTSPTAAWRSLERANHAVLHAGDSVSLAGGQTFKGALRLSRECSGTEVAPINICSSCERRAIIDAGAGYGLDLDGCAFVNVERIDVHGCGRKQGSNGPGIRIAGTGNVKVNDVDVSGFRLAGIQTTGDTATRITHVRATENGFAGIAAGEGRTDPVRNLYIGYCSADNNPGDPKNRDNHSGNGILAYGVQGGVIEYCEASNNGWDMPRKGNGPVGIWGCESDRLIIQHCISHDNKSPGDDGGGFDFDGGVTHSILQYNLSYHNAGCGYLLCQYAGASPWKDNVIRYNISFDDGAQNFHCGIGLWPGGGHFSGADVYNNTIINERHAVATDGDVPGVTYRNNIFVAGEGLLSGNFGHSRFENNLWWTTSREPFHRDGKTVHETLTDWENATGQEMVDGKPTAIFADPNMVMPDRDDRLPIEPQPMAAMRFFRLRDGSPAIGRGVRVPDNGGMDFFGALLAGAGSPSAGADQSGAAESHR
jgi:hypothetical protein